MSDPQRFGRFEVRGVLGTGATAIVYEGYDASLDRIVAIKTLREELLNADDAGDMLERFRREARIIARLRHENLILVYEFNEEWNPPFIAMERIEAPNLADRMKQGQRFSVEEVVKIITQLLAALAYIHAEGFVHRDVKPSNLFWEPAQPLKIADFGVAQIRSSTLTRIGTEVGTPAYMSPEQFLGDKVDARSDLWSCGVIFYELLTGQRMFTGAYETVREAVLTTQPGRALVDPTAQLPAAFAEVVQRALANDPAQRFQDAGEFRRAVQRAWQDSPADETAVRATDLQTGERPVPDELTRVRSSGKSVSGLAALRMPGPKHVLLAGAALVVLLLGVALFWLLQLRKPDVNEINRIVSAFSCADLNPVLDGRLLRISGFTQSKDDAANLEAQLSRVRGVQQVVSQLEVRGWPYCELLEVLAPFTKSEVPQAAGMRLRIQNYASRLTEGDLIVLDMVSPGFPAYIYVDYFQLDGNVVHLYPPPHADQRPLPAGASRVLPDPHDPLRLEVRSPFGQEMVVMIASREPLRAKGDAEFQPAREYLPVLKQILDKQSKGTVASDYLFLVTAPGGR